LLPELFPENLGGRDVYPSAEVLPSTAQHHAPHVCVVVQPLQRGWDVNPHLGIQGVGLVWAVQAQGTHVRPQVHVHHDRGEQRRAGHHRDGPRAWRVCGRSQNKGKLAVSTTAKACTVTSSAPQSGHVAVERRRTSSLSALSVALPHVSRGWRPKRRWRFRRSARRPLWHRARAVCVAAAPPPTGPPRLKRKRLAPCSATSTAPR